MSTAEVLQAGNDLRCLLRAGEHSSDRRVSITIVRLLGTPGNLLEDRGEEYLQEGLGLRLEIGKIEDLIFFHDQPNGKL